MLKKVLHALVAHPKVYDCVQQLAGSQKYLRRLRQMVTVVPTGSLVLDVGGGTGNNFPELPPGCTYICADIDLVKLIGFRNKIRAGNGLSASGTDLPLLSQSIDFAMCTFVSHHIPDDLLSGFFQECARVVKPGGQFLLYDAVLDPDNRIGKLIWKYDRGSFPRTAEVLRETYGNWFTVNKVDEFKIYHRYIGLLGEPMNVGSK